MSHKEYVEWQRDCLTHIDLQFGEGGGGGDHRGRVFGLAHALSQFDGTSTQYFRLDYHTNPQNED